MRVVCINDQWVPDEKFKNMAHPKIGDEDVVTEQIEEADTLYIYYRLERYGLPWYRACHFVDLPDAEPTTTTEEETLLQTA